AHGEPRPGPVGGPGPGADELAIDKLAIDLDLDNDLDAARAAFRDELRGSTPFAALVFNAALTHAEAEVLAVAASCEIDRRLRRLVASGQGLRDATELTLDALARIFEDHEVGPRAFAPDGALRRAALVDVVPEGAWSDHRIVVQPSVIWALLGDTSRDPQLPGDLQHVAAESGGGEGVVVVIGPDRIRRRQQAATHAAGDRFLVSGDLQHDATWAALAREATITGAGVIVEIGDELPAHGKRWIERADHLAWAITSRTDVPLEQLPTRPWISVEAGDEMPTDAEWAAHLGETPRTHPLTMTQLEQVSRAIASYGGDIDAAVRRLASGRLERLAVRVRPRHAWDDLVLSADRTALLRSIVDRYRHSEVVYGEWGFAPAPSRGLVALFSGPSGTGKTLATEVLAGELGLDVFKVNLATVVSKYIGETEKNLEEMFDAASAGNLLLFFDEADSLVGKRSEVRDARDRYANIEVSYLLQRLENYDGVVIMATNFEKNIDDAFLRRIHVRIAFQIPAETERLALWKHNLPDGAPTHDLDLPWMAAKFEVAGGAIRNATVQAAFLAAALGQPIRMEHLVTGVAGELRKMGRLVNPSEFGEFADIVKVL
ncbi:MAG: putative ATPase, partial [Ilumatobacteraceae bacterium]|nr:putative ATPase [Ilumatobacteraceae bacterium]